MARKTTVVCPSVPDTKPTKPLSYTIEVITPLFGGGVQAGINDPITLIRPSSIRGHLRFWWRATCGRKYKNIHDLRLAETAIWGSAEFSSPVSISVITDSNKHSSEFCQVDSEDKRKFYWNGKLTGENTRSSIPSYVLFPFQGKKLKNSTINEVTPKKFIPSTTFTLNARFPENNKYLSLIESINVKRGKNHQPPLPKINHLLQEIETAIWAWVNFGGIGARSRRGCGALFCGKLAPESLDDLNRTVINRLGKDWQIKPDNTIFWSQIGANILAGESNRLQSTDPYQTWRLAESLLWKFRQGTHAHGGIGRDNGYHDPKKPGMSRWPEAEIVRRLVLEQRKISARPNSNWHHNKRFDKTKSCFPRAEFGLPIILEIKDDQLPKEELPDGVTPKPLKPTIQHGSGEGGDRLASPVILRPLRFKNGKEEVPLLMLLHTPPLENVYLKPGETDLVQGKIYPVKMTSPTPKDCPLDGRTSTGSAIEAFIKYAYQSGWKTIGGGGK